MAGLLHLIIETAFAQPSSLPDGTFVSGCFSFFTTDPTAPPAPGIGFDCIANYIGALTGVIIAFTGAISLIMLMINGFRYMTGPAIPGGSSDAAKKGIQMALVGLGVSLLTYIILDTLIISVTTGS